jgi:hypothetical protein
MRAALVMLMLGFLSATLWTASALDICEVASAQVTHDYSGKKIKVEGKGEVYTDVDGTRTFIYSTCRVSYLGHSFDRKTFILISNIDDQISDHIIEQDKHYSVSGVLRRFPPPIYDGPVYGAMLEEPVVVENPTHP